MLARHTCDDMDDDRVGHTRRSEARDTRGEAGDSDHGRDLNECIQELTERSNGKVVGEGRGEEEGKLKSRGEEVAFRLRVTCISCLGLLPAASLPLVILLLSLFSLTIPHAYFPHMALPLPCPPP